MLKVNILNPINVGPYGGQNQLLRLLQKKFVKLNIYEKDPLSADVILINSFNFIHEKLLFYLKRLKRSGKKVIHRIDGPISLHRGKDVELDKIIYEANSLFADATIFQSEWSYKENLKLGIKQNKNVIIYNTVDSSIFNGNGRIPFSVNRKLKVLSVSWSSNLNKGFHVYKWLDNNLDFTRFSMKFIGNSPVSFNNIAHKPAMQSNELAHELKNSDIFISASKKEACSNSIIEALHCRLPVICLDDGANREIVGQGGEFFKKTEEIILLLDKIALNYKKYQKDIQVVPEEDTINNYIEFFEQVPKITNTVRNINIFSIYRKYYWWKVKQRYPAIFKE